MSILERIQKEIEQKKKLKVRWFDMDARALGREVDDERTRLLDERYMQSQDSSNQEDLDSSVSQDYLGKESLDIIIQHTAEYDHALYRWTLISRNLIDIAGTQVMERIQPLEAQQRSEEYQRLLLDKSAIIEQQLQNVRKSSTLPKPSKKPPSSPRNYKEDLALLNAAAKEMKSVLSKLESEAVPSSAKEEKLVVL
ncbi:hypothetical protein MP638_007544 [Amoeboaphelidium occidentale]|nr:hypothetical protein MP638_007544 [Amoeboaphelidium occidentale]